MGLLPVIGRSPYAQKGRRLSQRKGQTAAGEVIMTMTHTELEALVLSPWSLVALVFFYLAGRLLVHGLIASLSWLRVWIQSETEDDDWGEP